MKQLFFASVCALTLLSCGRDESEIQSENQVKIASSKSKKEKDPFAKLSGDIYVYRHYSNSMMKHWYGSAYAPVGQHDWSYEGVAFKTSSAPNNLYGLAVYFNPNNLDCVIATNQYERTSLEATGYVFKEAIGYDAGGPQNGAVPVYKYYRSSKNGHFYTKNLGELGWGGDGWTYEGVAFYAY
ncbi:hypothetical protein [Chryseobacterium sp. R2ACT005]|uniref:hypothetical protein n=1 Tax=Chryseobacterium sp. R2ACT005 TaxID=3416668 RepID=UPI003CF8DA4E